MMPGMSENALPPSRFGNPPHLNSDTLIKADILNIPTFNRSEATNMVMFYKTMNSIKQNRRWMIT